MDFRVIHWPVAFIAILAIFLNSFLIYIIYRYSSKTIGNYKWLLVFFCSFEATFALTVLLTIPIQFIHDKTIFIFSYDTILQSLGSIGPGFYCVLYEMWLGLIMVMFIYRYIGVCHPIAAEKISRSSFLKTLLFFFYFCHVVYAAVCGIYMCSRDTPSDKVKTEVTKQFGIADVDSLAYIIMRIKLAEGSVSYMGSIALANHYVLICTSVPTIFFCGFMIWRHIYNIQKDLPQIELRMQKQIFMTLVLQTVIPVLLWQLPALVYLTLAFWKEDNVFASSSPLLTVFYTLPKVLDPILAMICIQDYNRGVKKTFRCCSRGARTEVSTINEAITRTIG